MRSRAIFLSFLFVLTLLAGCQDEGAGSGGTPNPKRYATAVSLSPGATEILG